MSDLVGNLKDRFSHEAAICFQILAWQLVGLCVITAWTAAMTGLVFGLLRLFKVLRVPEEIEMKGKLKILRVPIMLVHAAQLKFSNLCY